MELPFDMKCVQVFLKNGLIYEDFNVPANSPIWICCDCSIDDLLGSDEEIGFTMNSSILGSHPIISIKQAMCMLKII